MKKLNNKGFAVTGILYTLLVLFLVLMISLISIFSNRKNVLNKLKESVLNVTYQRKYVEGTVMYFNPNTGEECHEEYTESQSATGVKSGCMKWYVLNESETNNTIDLILDHNTTAEIFWNSSGSNLSGPNELLTGLQSDTSNWSGVQDRTDAYTVDNGTSSYIVDYTGYKARIITVDEIAKLTGNINWNSNDISSKYFYFDSLTNTASPTCINGDTGNCKYGWLYDRTSEDCENYGCYNNGDINIYGYWTISPAAGNSNNVWRVYGQGRLSDYIVNQNLYGIRPVITISKNIIVDSTNLYNQYKYEYTGNVQEFVAPIDGTYKLEVWGASGGYAYDINRTTGDGGYGAYANGNIHLDKNDKLFVVIGGEGSSNCQTTDCAGGYNGGSESSKWASGDGSGLYTAGGGGATHIAKESGELFELSSSPDKVLIVAGGGGGGDYYPSFGKQATGANAGGISGGNSINSSNGKINENTGGTQETGYLFGKAGTTYKEDSTGGSGGGWYGGISQKGHSSGAGGSSYIGNTLLNSKAMYCYNCITSDIESTKTITTTNVSANPISEYAKQGNGYAKITIMEID